MVMYIMLTSILSSEVSREGSDRLSFYRMILETNTARLDSCSPYNQKEKLCSNACKTIREFYRQKLNLTFRADKNR